MSTDAIVLLKNDHKEIRKVFKEFQNTGENAKAKQAKLVDKILELLTVHTYIEEQAIYPRTRELLPDLEDDVLESYEEHHVADVLKRPGFHAPSGFCEPAGWSVTCSA